MEKKTNILIVHYNTPLLTECLIKSINKFVKNCVIHLFDNSEKYPFVYRQDNIIYYNNTKGQIINFKDFLSKYSNKGKTLNEWGSAKHCITIQKCIELIDDNFILLDSDVLLKKDITEICDNSKFFVGEVGHVLERADRVMPWLCFINVKMMKKLGLTFFNDQFMLGLSTNKDCDKYDTGGYLYYEGKNLPHTIINTNDYVYHFGAGSWNKNKSMQNVYAFLNSHRKTYSDETYKEKLIVTMTSWKDRIGNLKYVLGTILENTVLPNEIIVNLSEAEFPNKEADLLKSFVDFVNEHELIRINWVPGKNTKQWKKILPTLASHPKDAVICIDDDRKYPKDFIKTLYDYHLKNPNCPVTVNQKVTVCGMKQHCGHGTLDKLEYYGNMLDVFTDDIMQNPSSDTFFTYMCNRTGREMLSTPYDVNRSIKLWNEINPLHKTSTTYDPKTLREMVLILDKKFGLSFNNIKKVPPKAVTSKKVDPNGDTVQEEKRQHRAAVNIDEIMQMHYALKDTPKKEEGENKIKEIKTKNPVLRRHLISKSIKNFIKPSTF